MSAAVVVSVAPASPAASAGLRAGDAVVSVNGRVPRDVIEWRLWTDEADVELDVERDGLGLAVEISKREGEPLGAEVSNALFDRVRTCDNHCEFCFIYQLPKGLRRSLYLKDDDYRLSFLYGNFTTLTRFTEADLERVVTEGLSPLHVSIHTTDPARRAVMLRNPRGYSLARARVLMARGDTEGLDASALRAEVERAVGALEEGRRIRQQLTHAANGVEAAREILDGMERRVKVHLAQVDSMLAAAGAETD